MNPDQRFSVSIHVLTLLAATGRPLTSEQIAASVDTHPVVIRRTMAHLRQQGLVEARRGANGGWRLLRAAHEITLCSVYRTLETPAVLTRHSHPNPDCPVGGHIGGALERVFSGAQQALEQALGQFTVADVLDDVLAHARQEARQDAGQEVRQDAWLEARQEA